MCDALYVLNCKSIKRCNCKTKLKALQRSPQNTIRLDLQEVTQKIAQRNETKYRPKEPLGKSIIFVRSKTIYTSKSLWTTAEESQRRARKNQLQQKFCKIKDWITTLNMKRLHMIYTWTQYTSCTVFEVTEILSKLNSN